MVGEPEALGGGDSVAACVDVELFSTEYQDWLEAGRNTAGLAWSKVKDEWKKFAAEPAPK